MKKDNKYTDRYIDRTSYIQDALIALVILIISCGVYSARSGTISAKTKLPPVEIVCVYTDTGSLTGVVKVKEILSSTDDYIIFTELATGQTIKYIGTFVITTDKYCPRIGKYPTEL